jgi:hypothetical protein
MLRTGKKTVKENPKKNEMIQIEKYSDWKRQLPLISSDKILIDKK